MFSGFRRIPLSSSGRWLSSPLWLPIHSKALLRFRFCCLARKHSCSSAGFDGKCACNYATHPVFSTCPSPRLCPGQALSHPEEVWRVSPSPADPSLLLTCTNGARTGRTDGGVEFKVTALVREARMIVRCCYSFAQTAGLVIVGGL